MDEKIFKIPYLQNARTFGLYLNDELFRYKISKVEFARQANICKRHIYDLTSGKRKSIDIADVCFYLEILEKLKEDRG